MELDHRPRGGFGIGVSLKVTQGERHPIQYYREKELETEIVCDVCTPRYAIYGVFGYLIVAHIIPCRSLRRISNSRKELALATSVDKDLADHLIGDALENVVSAFDGFGR